MRILVFATFALALSFAPPGSLRAQGQADVDAIQQLIDQYGALEDAGDMGAQAELMSPDRVWIAAGRRTDQAKNMLIQQAAFDELKKLVPGIRAFTEDRDRLIRFHGNGSVAVASFYRYRTMILPFDAPREVVESFAPAQPTAVTLVLEKRGGEWKIVHTHISPLFSDAGG